MHTVCVRSSVCMCVRACVYVCMCVYITEVGGGHIQMLAFPVVNS